MKIAYLLLFMLVQQAASVAGQLLLKLGMAAETDFSWTWRNVGHLFVNMYTIYYLQIHHMATFVFQNISIYVCYHHSYYHQYEVF